MPLPVINDVFRCALRWSHDDYAGLAVNVIHVKNGSANAGEVATELDTHVAAGLWEIQDSHAHVYEVDVTPLDGSGVTYPLTTGNPAKWSGVSSDHQVMPQVANVVKLVTAKRGRSYRGRVYLPWVHEAAQENGLLVSGDLAIAQTAWETFLDAMDSAGFPLQVASYLHQTSEPVVAVLYSTSAPEANLSLAARHPLGPDDELELER